ncbi:hypothetical protein Krac_9864 [Ktedonobacter racemifer DSM 44963]|uniref:Uncharacterized protein n=1 Tax=Ktedonobacter racemifer DSM 44963 TaxID=485913 RepID=D6TE35_KTERA|nr:hypothetical protein Krac_9864 [Ktedonobacter racemifer DSM 44963]
MEIRREARGRTSYIPLPEAQREKSGSSSSQCPEKKPSQRHAGFFFRKGLSTSEYVLNREGKTMSQVFFKNGNLSLMSMSERGNNWTEPLRPGFTPSHSYQIAVDPLCLLQS